MGDERDQRHARLNDRLRAQRGRGARPEIIADVECLTGSSPGLDDFVSADATDRLEALYLAASNGPGTQRRTWSASLANELRTTMSAVAARLLGVEMWWLHRLSNDGGAVRVDGAAVLRHAAFSKRDYDLVLVTADAEDGLRVAFDQLPDADEFELVLWGRFASSALTLSPGRSSSIPRRQLLLMP